MKNVIQVDNLTHRYGRRLPGTVETGLVALTGIYGIVAINMVGLKD